MITPRLAQQLLVLESNDLLIRILSDNAMLAAINHVVRVKLQDGRERYIRVVRRFLERISKETDLFIDLSTAEAETINQARVHDPSFGESIPEMKEGDQVKRKKLKRATNIISNRTA